MNYWGRAKIFCTKLFITTMPPRLLLKTLVKDNYIGGQGGIDRQWLSFFVHLRLTLHPPFRPHGSVHISLP